MTSASAARPSATSHARHGGPHSALPGTVPPSPRAAPAPLSVVVEARAPSRFEANVELLKHARQRFWSSAKDRLRLIFRRSSPTAAPLRLQKWSSWGVAGHKLQPRQVVGRSLRRCGLHGRHGTARKGLGTLSLHDDVLRVSIGQGSCRMERAHSLARWKRSPRRGKSKPRRRGRAEPP